MGEINASPAGGRQPGPGVLRAVGYAGVAFGAATVLAGGAVLFGPGTARAAAGQAVPFVVWGNFLGGFAYVATGLGLARGRRWSVGLAAGIAAGTAVLALAFGAHVLAGGAFEPRTVVALLARTAAWAGVAVWARNRIGVAGREV